MGLDFEIGKSKQRYGRIQLRTMAMCGVSGKEDPGSGRALGGLRDGQRGRGESTKQSLLENPIIKPNTSCVNF